jgi:tyrosine-protein phosphatase YwqE
MGFLENIFGAKFIDDNVQVDMHSHILPGIDDGSQNIFDSIEMINFLVEKGKKKLIMTPHIMTGVYNNTIESVGLVLETLKTEVKERNIDIQLEAAAEYYLDEGFIEKLEKEEPLLCFGDKKYVLFETSYMNSSPLYNNAVFLMKTQGYSPVLAHPERYLYAYQSFEIYENLLERGVLFQLNTNSLTGYYSLPAQKMAEKLIDRGMVHFIGTDTHKIKHLQNLEKVHKLKYFKKLMDLPLLNNTLL